MTVTVIEEPTFDVGGYQLPVSDEIPPGQRDMIIRHLKQYTLVESLGRVIVFGSFGIVCAVILAIVMFAFALALKL